MKNIKLTIDGIEIVAEEGQTILEAARRNSIDIPTLCNDESVSPYGACGLCVVEVEGNPKLLRACATAAAQSMVIRTRSPRIHRARKFALEMLLSDHTGDCRAPCSLACPAGTDCQGYVGLIANADTAQALKVIKNNIPLPASIGRVCPHPCEEKCRRRLVDEPVAIASLKAYAADKMLDALELEGEPVRTAAPTGRRVCVIGGGPGGLSAAYYLALKGHSVTVYDMMPQMGGMLRYGIPEYRLPKKLLGREIRLIEKAGVVFKNNIKIGRDITFEQLRTDSDALVIATGAWESSKMRVKGEELDGVFGGIDFLRSVNTGIAPEIGRRVAVCGGGNTAMDACRTAVRLGAQEVFVIYRRTREEMPAQQLEIEEAMQEGVKFKFLSAPDEISGENGRVCGIKLQAMRLGEPDAGGRRRPLPIEGEFEYLELDSVIMAIGQKPCVEGLEAVGLTSRGTISAHESTFETNLDGVFAVGDATNAGADIAISAIGEAKKCAEVIHSYLNGRLIGCKSPVIVRREVSAEDLKDREHMPREKMATLDPQVRKRCFDEVALGLSDEQAKKEAARCLECGCLDYFNCKLINYANEFEADYSKFRGEKSIARKDDAHPFIIRDSGKCILCGLCVRVCSQVMGITAIGLAGRGFNTVVTPEFFKSLDDSSCISCGRCVDLCPTGALVEKIPFSKNVPLEEHGTDTICSGCAAACRLTVFSAGRTLTRVRPAEGSLLCSHGKIGFAPANSPERLCGAVVDGIPADIDTAAREAAKRIRGYKPDSVALTVCENMTDGELEAAHRLALAIGLERLINLGPAPRLIDEAGAAEYERLFTEKFKVGINRGAMQKLGAVDVKAVDFSGIKLIISLGAAAPAVFAETLIRQSMTAHVRGDILLALAGEFETDGRFDGGERIAKVIEPACGLSNEEIIYKVIKYLK